jgi:hypothetical protein
VGWTQIIFGVVLVLILLLVAILYGVRQIFALRRLPRAKEMPPEEWNYQRGQARRRLVTSLLFLLLGVMLAIALIYLEAPAEQLSEERAALEKQGPLPPLLGYQRAFVRHYTIFWILFLLVLMAVVLLAALDFWATRRYGLRQHRKLVADRRAMIEREVTRLRRERNGYH